jgi:hypothetical protein
MTLPTAFEDLDHTMRELAYQLATGMHGNETLMKRFGLSLVQFEAVCRHPKFIKLLHTARIEWDAAQNTVQRTELKGAIATEEAIPYVYAMITDKTVTGTARVEAFKALSKIGRVGERAERGAGVSGEMFKLVINLGNDKKLEIEKTIPSNVIEHDDMEFADA